MQKPIEARRFCEAGPYFLSLVEAGQDCVRVLSPDGALQHVNAQGRALLEMGEAAPALGAYWPTLWPEDTRPVVERAVQEGAAGRPSSFRGFCPTAKGTGKWWDTSVVPIRGDDGEVAWLLATSRDVTEEIETRSFLDTILNLLPLALMVKSASDGRYVLINQAAEELLGMPADDIIGRTALEIFPKAVGEAFAAEDAEVIRSQSMKVTEEEPVQLRSGELRYFATKKVATYGDDGARHLVSVAEDVTERHLAASSLRTALDAAESANHAKTAFLANMSHEIRTPLNGVVGVADLLSQRELGEREKELVGLIQASGKTLTALLNDILDFATMEAGKVAIENAAFDLGEVLRATGGIWQAQAEAKGLAFDFECSDVEGWVRGDRVRLSQIIGNLLNNAVKFTSSGTIALGARRTAEGHLRICVRDTGVGFDASKAELIFGRFQQADDSVTRQFGGAGLGLAISRELVERMGGAMGCEGAPGKGAAFWFELPLEPVDASTPAITETDQALAPMRCLLADDHPTNRKVIELMVSGFAQVVSVENGQEALDAFRKEPFDIVLMDMQMPVMDGLTSIREIRRFELGADRPSTPIIMLTANAMPEHVDASLAAGADLHLAKPITLATLIEGLDRVMSSEP